ncbi:MAG: SRPBCC family protein, partial [Yaniella sp.]|nr:SRPBCC family protein [Yaniella sp.]
AWVVGDGYVQWTYKLEPLDDGTELTEFWEFLPAGVEMFHDKFGDNASGLIEARIEDAHRGIPATLAAIKQLAEK